MPEVIQGRCIHCLRYIFYILEYKEELTSCPHCGKKLQVIKVGDSSITSMYNGNDPIPSARELDPSYAKPTDDQINRAIPPTGIHEVSEGDTEVDESLTPQKDLMTESTLAGTEFDPRIEFADEPWMVEKIVNRFYGRIPMLGMGGNELSNQLVTSYQIPEFSGLNTELLKDYRSRLDTEKLNELSFNPEEDFRGVFGDISLLIMRIANSIYNRNNLPGFQFPEKCNRAAVLAGKLLDSMGWLKPTETKE